MTGSTREGTDGQTLFGRDRLIESIGESLTSAPIRLLTLTGPGGIGKTRVALEVAARSGESFRDGAQVLRFASVTDPALVPATIARALGVRLADDPRAWNLARDRHCLLVLDNLEQLVDASPVLVDVLTWCPGVTILATSRQPLRITGEHEQPIPPLDLPADDDSLDRQEATSAVALFVQRATTANPAFQLDTDNANAVAEICRIVDGLPLAIELAAARSDRLSPQEIFDRLESSVDLLQGGPKDRPRHQRSLRETIAWSVQLLEPEEQVAFRRLASFAGGFTVQAAAHACLMSDDLSLAAHPDGFDRAHLDILDLCQSLVNKSLIHVQEEESGEPRFAMLRTIRAYALEDLRQSGEGDEITARHAAWFTATAGAAGEAMGGPDQAAWLDRLDLDLPNLRLALEWTREHNDPHTLARLCRDLGTFWLLRGHVAEGTRWIETVITDERSLETDPVIVMDLHRLGGWFAIRRGDLNGARRRAESSLAAAYDNGSPPEQVAAALRLLGEIEDRATNYPIAGQLHRQALAAYQAAGNQDGIADVLTALGGIALDTGAYAEAELCFREAMAATDDSHTMARVIDALSVTLHVKGDVREALACAERARSLFRDHGDVRGIAVSTDHIGKCSRDLGDIERAWAAHRESLPWRRKFGDPRGLTVWLDAVAGLLASVRDFDTAAVILAGVDAFRLEHELPRHNHETVQLAPIVAAVEKQLSQALRDRAKQQGESLSLIEVVELALETAERMVPDWLGSGLTRYGLTERELEIVDLLAAGLSDKAIGDRLGISHRTVNTHANRIFAKVGVHNRHDLSQLVEGHGEDESAIR